MKLFFVLLFFYFTVSEVFEMNHELIIEIFDYGKPALILLHDDSVRSIEAKKAFAEFSEIKTHLIYVEANKMSLKTSIKSTDDNFEDATNFNFFKRITEFLGISQSDIPNVIHIHYPNLKHEYHAEHITYKGLIEFVDLTSKRELEEHYMSEDIFYSNESKLITKVVSLNFEEKVINSREEVVVFFYAPWCGLSHKLEKILLKTAEKLKKNTNILFMEIDGTKNEVKTIKIQRFPSLYYFKKNKNVIEIENIPESPQELIRWIRLQTMYEWVFETEQELEEDL